MKANLKNAAAIALFLQAIVTSAMAQPVALPVPSDLRNESRLVQQKGKPLVVLFALPGCPFCKEVRENYLVPLVRDAAPADQAIVREIDITSAAPFKDFQGQVVTQSQFAARYKVRVAPTVIMLDASGSPLTDPLVGSGMAGFYGAYLDNALSSSERRLKDDKSKR